MVSRERDEIYNFGLIFRFKKSPDRSTEATVQICS